MDSTTIIPPGVQAFTTRSGENHHNDVSQALLVDQNVSNGTRQVLEAVSNTGQHLHNNIADGDRSILKDLADNSRAVLKEIADEGSNDRAANERLSLANQASVERQNIASRIAIDRSEDSVKAQMERLALRGYDSTESWGYRGVKATDDSSLHTQIAFKEQLLELEKAKQVLERQAADNRYSIERQAADNKCLLERQAADNKAHVELLMVKGQIEALRHADNLAAQAAKERADCCCEMKELIIQKATHTDDLIRKAEIDRQKDEIVKLRQELLAVRLNPAIVAPVV